MTRGAGFSSVVLRVTNRLGLILIRTIAEYLLRATFVYRRNG
jgi:hypothetical protein